MYSIGESSSQQEEPEIIQQCKDELEKTYDSLDQYLNPSVMMTIKLLLKLLHEINVEKLIKIDQSLSILAGIIEKSIKNYDKVGDFQLSIELSLLQFQNLASTLKYEIPIFEFADEEANKLWEPKFAYKKEDFLAKIKEISSEFIEEVLDATSDGVISVTDFKLYLSWFGPLKESFKNSNTICFCPYFFGSMSSLESQLLLDKEKIGTFLIRFSDKDFGQFIISVVEEDEDQNIQTLHFKVFKKNNLFYILENETQPEYPSSSLLLLIDKYPLTFRIPYKNDDLKNKRHGSFSQFRGFINKKI